MRSCEMLGHDVEHVRIDPTLWVFRHGEHRFGYPPPLTVPVDEAGWALWAAYERSMDDWLALVHRLGALV